MPTEQVAAIIAATNAGVPDLESEMPTTLALDQPPAYTGQSTLEALNIMSGPSSSSSTMPSRQTVGLSPQRTHRPRLWKSSARTDSPPSPPLLRRVEVPRQAYPTWHRMQAQQSEMERRLAIGTFRTEAKSRKVGLLIDTGAYDNIGGTESDWFKEHLAYLHRLGMRPTIRDIPAISVSGVGAGAAHASQAFTFPGAVLNSDGRAENVFFDTPIVDGSPIPPLWGLQSLRRHRALIDCQGLKLHLLGAGDLQLRLPPGSRSFPLELSEGGHMILPINEFETLKDQNKHGIAPKKALTFAAHPELIDIPAREKTMVSQGTQTDGNVGARRQPLLASQILSP